MPPKRFFKKRNYDDANSSSGVPSTDQPQIQFDVCIYLKVFIE